MGHIAHAYPKTPKPPRQKCQATIEDYKNGTSYNLARSFTVPKIRQCSRNATSKIGALCLCTKHVELVEDGLVQEDGTVATRAAIADVRRYLHKFPGGLYNWACDLKAEEIK